MLFKVLALLMLGKLLLISRRPLLCATIYIIVMLAVGWLDGVDEMRLLVAGAIQFAIAYLYFWLLQKTRDIEYAWWIIFCLGLVLGMV
ncbi:MAG: hypothetical protein NTX50_08930 [Candidatus Sumerlaeota bacterium]|nr:hypothetical protein [Candidatus Sumerlaeota bacterium]